MTKIITTSAQIRAHRPDPAMIARLKAKRDQDIESDPDEATSEPVFRIREAVRRRIVQAPTRTATWLRSAPPSAR